VRKIKPVKVYALFDNGDGMFWQVDFNKRQAEMYKRGIDTLVPCMLVPIEPKKRRAKR